MADLKASSPRYVSGSSWRCFMNAHGSFADRIGERELSEDCRLTLVAPNRNEREVVLRVQELSKAYGPVEALTAVTLNVRAGEVFGLLGPNGAGKTTLISILSTQRLPSTGDALVLGRSVRAQLIAVRQMIGIAPQEIALYPTLTAAENLHFFGRIYGLPGVQLAARVEQLLAFVGLQDRADDRVETYSGGMKRR